MANSAIAEQRAAYVYRECSMRLTPALRPVDAAQARYITVMHKMTFIALLPLLAMSATAGEKSLMHCFAFTVIETATPSEWEAFAKATDALPAKIPAITKVWHGKLRAPINIFNTDAETRKKLMAGEEKVTGPVLRLQRKHGVCMQMTDEGALKTYAAHPYHAEWMAAYEKVRVAGTTTMDIIGQ